MQVVAGFYQVEVSFSASVDSHISFHKGSIVPLSVSDTTMAIASSGMESVQDVFEANAQHVYCYTLQSKGSESTNDPQ